VVQSERGRQMRQIIGHGRPGRSDALPRRRHAVWLQRHLAIVGILLLRPTSVEVYAADTREILVDLQRAGSEVGADHGEVYLLENITRTERGSHRQSVSLVPCKYGIRNTRLSSNAAPPGTGRYTSERPRPPLSAAIVSCQNSQDIENRDTRWLR